MQQCNLYMFCFFVLFFAMYKGDSTNRNFTKYSQSFHWEERHTRWQHVDSLQLLFVQQTNEQVVNQQGRNLCLRPCRFVMVKQGQCYVHQNECLIMSVGDATSRIHIVNRIVALIYGTTKDNCFCDCSALSEIIFCSILTN